MKRILVRAPNWIGDQVMAFPFFYKLRQQNPNAWIAVVCTEWVRDLQFIGLVDEVFVIPKRKRKGFFSSMGWIIKTAKRIKKIGPWDQGWILPNSFGSAALFKLAKVKFLTGYAVDARSFLLNNAVQWDGNPHIHRSQSYLNLIPGESRNDVALIAKNFDPIKYWAAVAPQSAPDGDYFVVAPGATAVSRRWFAESFRDLILQIQKRYGWQCVVVGGPAEKKIADWLKTQGVRIDDRVGQGSVASLWRVFRSAKVTITNESGLSHVSALCRSPVQIVCGAADPKRTHPIGPGKYSVYTNPVECWPCERNTCSQTGSKYLQCLRGIRPEQVLDLVEKELFTD